MSVVSVVTLEYSVKIQILPSIDNHTNLVHGLLQYEKQISNMVMPCAKDDPYSIMLERVTIVSFQYGPVAPF